MLKPIYGLDPSSHLQPPAGVLTTGRKKPMTCQLVCRTPNVPCPVDLKQSLADVPKAHSSLQQSQQELSCVFYIKCIPIFSNASFADSIINFPSPSGPKRHLKPI